MKISGSIIVILLLQAALAMVIIADNHVTSVGEGDGKAIDINPGKLKCCSNCNFFFSGLYTCDDVVVDNCDPVCKSCAVVNTYPVKEVKCTDTFLGICDPPCN